MPKQITCNRWKCGACCRNQSTSADVCSDCGAKKSIGTKDCIEEGKRRKFEVFMKTLDPKHSRRTPLDNEAQSEEESSDDDSDNDSDNEEYADPVAFDEEDNSHVVETKKYGKLHFRTAETLLLNGGKSSIGTKSRKARFLGDVYTGITSDIMAFKQPFCGCSDALQIGTVCSLPKNSDPTNKVRGKISYLSYGHAPLRFYCKKHSVVGAKCKLVAWVSVRDRYVRCIVP